jgi:hypothetical protein
MMDQLFDPGIIYFYLFIYLFIYLFYYYIIYSLGKEKTTIFMNNTKSIHAGGAEVPGGSEGVLRPGAEHGLVHQLRRRRRDAAGRGLHTQISARY